MTHASNRTGRSSIDSSGQSHRVIFVTGDELRRIEADPYLTAGDVWEVIEA